MKTFSSKEMIERLKMGLELPSDNALAELLGISKTTLSNWKSRNSIDIPLVFSKCEQLSIDWLLTGTGTMFKSTEEGPIIDVKPIHHPRSTEKKRNRKLCIFTTLRLLLDLSLFLETTGRISLTL